MGKTFLPGTVRNYLSQFFRFDTRGLSQSYGILSIVIIMILIALLLSYIMITSCDEDCRSRSNTVFNTKITNRDLTFACHDPGSIFILYELEANDGFHLDGNSTAIDLNALNGRAEKLPKPFIPLIT